MRPETFVRVLEEAKRKLADEALTAPAGRDSFEYGRVVGMHSGLEHAKNLLLDLLNDDEQRGANL